MIVPGGGPGRHGDKDPALTKELIDSLAKMVAVCQLMKPSRNGTTGTEGKLVHQWFKSLSLQERVRALAVTDPTVITLLVQMSHTCRDHQDRPRPGHRIRALQQPTFLVFQEMLHRQESRQRAGVK